MKDKLFEIFKNGCTSILEEDGSKISKDTRLFHLMDELDLVEIVMYMEENLERELAIDIEEKYLYKTVEEFVEIVCESLK